MQSEAPPVESPIAAAPVAESANGLKGRKDNQAIAGDVVNKATAELNDTQRSAIRRFHAHYVEHGLGLDEAADLIRLDGSTLSLVFRGKYPASLENITEKIESFFELLDKRSQGRKIEFIPTKLTERIWNICSSALELQRIAFIIGESQIGKTEALEAYARTHNHGSTIYLCVPTGGCLGHFLVKLAEKLRICTALREADLRRRIIEAFDDRMLLIIDEAHRCIPGSRHTDRRIQTLDFIRELYDERKCGLVICATRAFGEAMERGAIEKFLRQIKRRRLCTAMLPDRPTQEDLNTFSAAYGLPPSSGKFRELEKQMIDEEALGMWLTLLRMGAKIAVQSKKAMAWSHVLSAHAGLQLLEGKTPTN